MKRKWICLGALLLALCLLLCACGQEKFSDASSPSAANKSGAAFGTNESYSYSGAADPASAMPPKIIRTAEVYAETKTYDEALTQLKAKITATGGYVSDSRSYANGNEGGRSTNMTARIPAEKLDEFLAYVEGSVHVTSSSVSSNDVSTRYYDIQARLETLRAEKAALDEMLTHAATTSETLAIRAQLTDVTQDIESYETQIRLYDDRISYSTVTISLDEVVVFSPENERFGARLANAFRESWSGFRNFCANFVLFLIYALPVLVVILVILGVALTILYLRRRKKGNPKKPPEPTDKSE